MRQLVLPIIGREKGLICTRILHMPRKLPHYLHIERRKAGLTQLDVATLLGDRTASKVSRYERGRRMPPLPTALAYQAILGRPVAELFGGMYGELLQDVRRRAVRLLEDARTPRGTRFQKRKRSLELIAGQ